MKKRDNDFLRTELTFAIVVHASVEDIQKIKGFLDGLEDLRVVYQKCSAGRLYITEEGGLKNEKTTS